MGWITVLNYALVFIACGVAAMSGTRNARFWAALCLFMLLLGAAKATAADVLLADLIRIPLRNSELYDERRGYQEAIIAGLFAAAALAGALLLYRKRAARFPVKLAAFASVGLLGFIVIRSVSLHQVDELLGIKAFGISVNAVIENAAIIVIGICAAITSRWTSGRLARNGLQQLASPTVKPSTSSRGSDSARRGHSPHKSPPSR